MNAGKVDINPKEFIPIPITKGDSNAKLLNVLLRKALLWKREEGW